MQVRHHHLANELTVVAQPVLRGYENQLRRLQRDCHRGSDAIGVDPVRLALAAKAKGRNDRNNVLVQQRFEDRGVNPFHLPREQMVDAVNDPQRECDDGIGGRRAEIVGRKATQNLVRETVGGFDGELQCRGLGHAGTVEVGRLNILLLGERLNLFGSAVHQHHPDVQGTQDGDIEENVGEVFVCDDTRIHRDNERLLAELRNVLEDRAQICELHRVSGCDFGFGGARKLIAFYSNRQRLREIDTCARQTLEYRSTTGPDFGYAPDLERN